jgi:L-iditol 2-dehydrogenase
MRQAHVPAVGAIRYRDVERPVPAEGEVVLRVARVGICGSDVHVFKGEHPIVQPPLVQGHEASGWVEALGPGVDGLAVGDVAAIEPAIGCGTCERCALGLMAQCARLDFIGGNLEGAGSELFLVPAAQLLRMRPTTSVDDAAMTEPLACAVHALRRSGGVEGRDVLVTGGGPIGALVAQVAALGGARTVVASDPLEGRRRALEACGLQAVTPAGIADPDALAARLGGRRPTVAFECAGAEPALATCLGGVARGGVVVIVGVYPGPPRADMVAVQDHELNVFGSLMYTWDDFREAGRLIDDGRVRLGPLQSHHVPFEHWADGYRLIDDPDAGAMKVLVDVAPGPD